jgi:CRISPR type I-E-associated protein CasB/Cse2
MSTETGAPSSPRPATGDVTQRSPRTRPDTGYVDWLLIARERPQVRSALRRGDIPTTTDRAYRYLARFWADASWLRPPILLHAATAATHIRSRQADGKTLGTVAANLVSTRILSSTTVAARLLAVQRMDLPTAHRHLAGILHAADAGRAGVDWRALYELYRFWDFPDLESRQRTRRTLLEQFHTRIPG